MGHVLWEQCPILWAPSIGEIIGKKMSFIRPVLHLFVRWLEQHPHEAR